LDWTLTGALVGVTIVATTVGYEFYVLTRSHPEPAKEYQATAILIPASERPAVAAPAVADTPALQTSVVQVSPSAGSAEYPSRVETPLPVGSKPTDHAPPPDHGSSAHNEVKPQSQPQISSDSWRIQTTAKANYFNLGGHVDKNGVVDSLASSYLRDALKKHKNYAKLPAQVKAYIDSPNVNLAKIAGYRALLGVSRV
jgi:hypothetical protein